MIHACTAAVYGGRPGTASYISAHFTSVDYKTNAKAGILIQHVGFIMASAISLAGLAIFLIDKQESTSSLLQNSVRTETDRKTT